MVLQRHWSLTFEIFSRRICLRCFGLSLDIRDIELQTTRMLIAYFPNHAIPRSGSPLSPLPKCKAHAWIIGHCASTILPLQAHLAWLCRRSSNATSKATPPLLHKRTLVSCTSPRPPFFPSLDVLSPKLYKLLSSTTSSRRSYYDHQTDQCYGSYNGCPEDNSCRGQWSQPPARRQGHHGV
jgi:hypothetical protein